MAKDPTNPAGAGSGQVSRTGQAGRGEGAYFEGEGHEPFAREVPDRDSKEAEAVVDDLMDSLLGGNQGSKPGSGTASG